MTIPIHLGAGDDTLKGGAGKSTLIGAAGNDVLLGHRSHDFLDGGKRADTMAGGAGQDTIVISSGRDKINDCFADDRDHLVIPDEPQLKSRQRQHHVVLCNQSLQIKTTVPNTTIDDVLSAIVEPSHPRSDLSPGTQTIQN